MWRDGASRLSFTKTASVSAVQLRATPPVLRRLLVTKYDQPIASCSGYPTVPRIDGTRSQTLRKEQRRCAQDRIKYVSRDGRGYRCRVGHKNTLYDPRLTSAHSGAGNRSRCDARDSLGQHLGSTCHDLHLSRP